MFDAGLAFFHGVFYEPVELLLFYAKIKWMLAAKKLNADNWLQRHFACGG